VLKNRLDARRFAEWEALVLRYAPRGASSARVDLVADAADHFFETILRRVA
jgi:hypothetical protein